MAVENRNDSIDPPQGGQAAAATAASATALNAVNGVASGDVYYKNRFVDWSAFTTDLVGNTAGW